MIDVQDALSISKQHVQNALCNAAPGLNDMTTHLAQSAGKGIRTLLLVTSAANSENKVTKDVTYAAAAIELLHMATLVHDDVMDDADTRRGLPTVHKKFDTKSAVICGDYLLSLSLSTIANINVTESEKQTSPAPHLIRSLTAICKGEYSQHINVGNFDMNLSAYLRIISGKTAMLFTASACIGAVLGGESDATVKDLSRFGRCLGMIFQIIDDCNDYESSEAKSLKPVVNDIKNGIITLPLILAINKNPDLRKTAKQALLLHDNLPDFAQSVQNAGGVDAARAVALRYSAWATKALKNVCPEKRQALLSILNNIL